MYQHTTPVDCLLMMFALLAMGLFLWATHREAKYAHRRGQERLKIQADQTHRTAVLDSVRYFDLAEHMDRSGLASGATLLRDEALRLAASVHTGIRIRRGCTDE